MNPEPAQEPEPAPAENPIIQASTCEDFSHLTHRILLNQAQCLSCLDVITSRHRHDFQTCRCGSLHVDGGRDYLKRGGAALYPDALGVRSGYREMSTYRITQPPVDPTWV